jgi:hypothetical protein
MQFFGRYCRHFNYIISTGYFNLYENILMIIFHIKLPDQYNIVMTMFDLRFVFAALTQHFDDDTRSTEPHLSRRNYVLFNIK